MDTPSPRESKLRRPHPLAVALVERLRAHPNARVLELGTGSGRNTAALEAAGFSVCSIADDRTDGFTADYGFDAALSTHALLHGTPLTIEAACVAVARLLKNGAPFYATFGSKSDARYGKGVRIDESTFAPEAGDEAGAAHAYFERNALREMLERHFIVESIEEQNVDAVVGSWAHARAPEGFVHWIVRARRPESG